MATIQNINISTPNDGLGDSLRASQIKANDNFAELNDKKVEKESGKGLTSNDFTDVEQTKLAGIASGAEVNVQADFLQDDDTQDDYIKNKPPQLYAGIGYFDYNDSGTNTLTYVAGVDKKITNDTTGAFTNISDAPYNVSELWNATTNQFDFNQLGVGDMVDIRVKLIPTTGAANETMKVKIKFGIGSPSEFIETFDVRNRKTASTDDMIFYTGFYIGSEDIRTYPAEIFFHSDGGGTFKVGGFYIRAIRKDVALLPFNNESDFVKKEFQAPVFYSGAGSDVIFPLPASGRTEINLTSASLVSLAGVDLSLIAFIPTAEYPYEGKEFLFRNKTGNSITFKHGFATDFPFTIKGGTDLVLPNNENLIFRFNNDGMYDVRDYVDISAKLDKVTSAGVERAYGVNVSGNQVMLPTSVFGGTPKRTFFATWKLGGAMSASTSWYKQAQLSGLRGTFTVDATLTPANNFSNVGIQTPAFILPFQAKIKSISVLGFTNGTTSATIRTCVMSSLFNGTSLTNPLIVGDVSYLLNSPSLNGFRHSFTSAGLTGTTLPIKTEIRLFNFNNSANTPLQDTIISVEFEEVI